MTRSNYRPLAWTVAALLWGAGPVFAQASQTNGTSGDGSRARQVREEASGLVIVDSGSTEGTITAIDPPSRTVTVATNDGRTVSGKVDASVGGLDLVKVGDGVTARYEEKRIFSVTAPNGVAPASGFDSVVVTSRPQELPAAIASLQATGAWLIIGADLAASTITLVSAGGGEVRTYAVATPEGRARLSRVKPGDRLSLTVVSYVFGVVTRKL